LTSAPVGGEWSASRPGRFTAGESVRGTHWIGGWLGHRTGLDDVEKRKFLTLPGLELVASRYTDHATPAHGDIIINSGVEEIVSTNI
jgi:hypothetical protein